MLGQFVKNFTENDKALQVCCIRTNYVQNTRNMAYIKVQMQVVSAGKKCCQNEKLFKIVNEAALETH